LSLGDNQISDITTISDLANLTELHLWINQISDITSLSNLTNLTQLGLSWNQISDISPLQSLTSLTALWLNGNQISDIEPLVNNIGFSEGDTIGLTDNPLSTTSLNVYIPQLEARGVEVILD
jgi:Leucine-rich repeat (LRR) protein